MQVLAVVKQLPSLLPNITSKTKTYLKIFITKKVKSQVAITSSITYLKKPMKKGIYDADSL